MARRDGTVTAKEHEVLQVLRTGPALLGATTDPARRLVRTRTARGLAKAGLIVIVHGEARLADPVIEGTPPAPHKLWEQANHEHQGDPEARRLRYVDLMREHGYLVEREPGGERRWLGCEPRRIPAGEVQIGDLVYLLLADHETPVLTDEHGTAVVALGLRTYDMHGIVRHVAIQHDTGEAHIRASSYVTVRRGIDLR